MSLSMVSPSVIENRNQLVEHFDRGCKPRSDWRIGTEHEKFTFYREGYRPVPYEGTNGIRALLEGLIALIGWEPYYDGAHIIILKDLLTGAAISLEPGGQFELSGAPVQTQYLEMRGADVGLQAEICALSAFWTGILYNNDSLENAWELVRSWCAEQRLALRHDVPTHGLDSKAGDIDLRTVAAQALQMSRAGLKARANHDPDGNDEQVYLAPLDAVVSSGMTQADRLIDLYKGGWQGDLTRFFEHSAF